MGRRPCCAKEGLNRGPWTALEDKTLIDYIKANGEGKWRDLPARAGLLRCGKSCRLRWVNYLNPEIKRGNINAEEEDLIIRLHKLLGNRWSLIAGRLPGRTDNEIKNYWNTILCKKVQDQSQPPKRKPRKKSNKKKSTTPTTTALPELASSPVTNVSPQPSLDNSLEAMSETLSNSVDIQSNNNQNLLLDNGSTSSTGPFLDEYYAFLLGEDTYQDISSGLTTMLPNQLMPEQWSSSYNYFDQNGGESQNVGLFDCNLFEQ